MVDGYEARTTHLAGGRGRGEHRDGALRYRELARHAVSGHALLSRGSAMKLDLENK